MGYFSNLSAAVLGRGMRSIEPDRDLAAVRFGASDSVGNEGGWSIRSIGGGKTKSSVSVNEQSALHLPVVYACVNRIGNPIARFPLRIMQPNVSGSGSSVVTQHPMSDIGIRPNERMSSRTLRKTCQAHSLLWGNGYMEIQRNGRGEAVGLWPLLPWNTRPKVQRGEFWYQTSIDGQQYRLEQEDVIHIMDLSIDAYEGKSQIAMSREALGMAFAMEEFGAKFFANDAKSGGFLMHPGRLSTGAQGNLRGGGAPGAPGDRKPAGERSDAGALLERQSGLENAHRVKVLEEGMKFIQTMIPPEDSQFLGSREFQTAEIARIYDVPLILLQSHEKSTSWGTGIEQLMIGFIRQTVAPWVGAYEQELNWKLFTKAERERGLYVKFNMNEYLRGDSAARGAFYKEMFGVGAMSPNDICSLEDIDGSGDAGNERFVPANYMPLSRAREMGAPAPIQAPAPPTAPEPEEEDEAA